MKNLIFVFIAVILQSNQVSSQEQDSLIQLRPGIGDTLNIFDRYYFKFYLPQWTLAI